jgi:hypothetical protein
LGGDGEGSDLYIHLATDLLTYSLKLRFYILLGEVNTSGGQNRRNHTSESYTSSRATDGSLTRAAAVGSFAGLEELSIDKAIISLPIVQEQEPFELLATEVIPAVPKIPVANRRMTLRIIARSYVVYESGARAWGFEKIYFSASLGE